MTVVAGPNGAGKTTFAIEYATRFGIEYLSTDAIAAQLSPDDPTGARLAAGREFSRRIHASLDSSRNLVVESTLAGRMFQRLLLQAKSMGLEVTIVYLFLDSAEMCIRRVKERVEKGGHSVPADDIRRRFARSADNFWNMYRNLADHWLLVYNSDDVPQDVAIGDSINFSVRDPALFQLFQSFAKAHD